MLITTRCIQSTSILLLKRHHKLYMKYIKSLSVGACSQAAHKNWSVTFSIVHIYMDLLKQSEGFSFPSPLSFEKRYICNYFPSPLPHHYLWDLRLSLSRFVLVVHQELCFDIHVTAWLRCKRDSCKVLGHLLLLLCFLFTYCTFSFPPLSSLPPWYILSAAVLTWFNWVCVCNILLMWFTEQTMYFTTEHIMTHSQVTLSLMKKGRKEGRWLRPSFYFAVTHFVHSEVLHSTAFTIPSRHMVALWSVSVEVHLFKAPPLVRLRKRSACSHCWSGVKSW